MGISLGCSLLEYGADTNPLMQVIKPKRARPKASRT